MFKIVMVREFLQSIYCKNSKKKKKNKTKQKKKTLTTLKTNKGLPLFILVAKANLRGFFILFSLCFLFYFFLIIFFESF